MGSWSQHKKMWSLRLRTPARRRMDRTTPVNKTVTILQGATNATFSLQTLADIETDPDETIILTISTTSDGGFEALEVDENNDECHDGY